MNIALLSNITVTSIAMRLNRDTGRDVYQPHGFNTWIQEISDPESGLYKSWARVVFILLHGPSLFGDIIPETSEEAEAVLTPMIEAIASASERHENMTFVASTIDIPNLSVRPLVSRRPEAQASAFWRRSLEERGIPIMELSEIAANVGRERFYNRRVWYMGSMPFSQAGEEALAAEIERIWRAIGGGRKKCLALDLDNTLWGGVLGELGADGIHLDRTGSGSRFYDFQRLILDLKNSGVLLAVISKNNPEDAMRAINCHPDMLLREPDFVAIRANWERKAANLESIAAELNIGTDSFVFIDDNPIEREEMKIAHPEVEVPEFPNDTAQLVPFMNEVARNFFLQLRTTDEDEDKTDQYRAASERATTRSAFGCVGDYLKYLEMLLTVEPLSEHNIPRAAQLTQKTNQFNLTTRRRTEAEMRAMLADPSSVTLIGSLSDRFGSYGKIILCTANITCDTAFIDTFLMSCRVMGRGVENAFIRAVERELAARGVKTLTAEFIPSGKNSVVSRFWSDVGYGETGGEAPGGGKTYRTTLPRDEEPNDTIEVRGPE